MKTAKLFLGEWNTKTIVGVALGAALFGVLMVFGGITVFTNTRLTTAVLVPVIVGALFGPLPAAVAAGLGNVVADFIGAWGYWFDWSVGNAVLGFFIGLLPVYGAVITKGKFTLVHAVIFVVLGVVGNFVGFGIVTLALTLLLYGGELNVSLTQAWAAGISNSIVLVVGGLPLLFALSKVYASSRNLTKE
jgi:energy-coupling factor transport system substrate-specific component